MEKVKHRTAGKLVHRLTTATTTSALSSTLSEIRLLSKLDPSIRSPLADSGLIPILTHLLLKPPQNQQPEEHEHEHEREGDNDTDTDTDIILQENALATLLNLSITSPSSLMSSPSLLPSLSSALLRPSPPILAQHAAATLFSLLSVETYRPIIGSKKTLILSPLISLLKSPNSPTRSIKDSLKALFGVALYPLNRPHLVELGAVPALFSIVVNYGGTGIAEDASAVIAQVAGCYESVDAFREVGGVRILVGMLVVGEGSRRATENAAAALLNLAMSCGERAVGDMREVEAVEEVVREVAERGSERARRKAEGLLRVLESGRVRWNLRHSEEFDRFSDDQSLARSSSSMDTTSF